MTETEVDAPVPGKPLQSTRETVLVELARIRAQLPKRGIRPSEVVWMIQQIERLDRLAESRLTRIVALTEPHSALREEEAGNG